MLLAIDAGNTNVVFAVHDGVEWRGRWRIRAFGCTFTREEPDSHWRDALYTAEAVDSLELNP